MRALVPFLLLLVPPLAAAARPLGDCPPPAAPPAALVETLVRWIGAETGYDTAPSLAAPPAIRFCRTGKVIGYEGAGRLVDPTLRAAHDARARAIFLVLPWDAADPFDRSVLLHELVHHVQVQARDWPCPGARAGASSADPGEAPGQARGARLSKRPRTRLGHAVGRGSPRHCALRWQREVDDRAAATSGPVNPDP